RDLAKVEVTSSNLVTRSNFPQLLNLITTRILRGSRAEAASRLFARSPEPLVLYGSVAEW
ncbi:MAG: hypothetical protein ACPGD3_06690, partial [Luminiphilus sp.]